MFSLLLKELILWFLFVIPYWSAFNQGDVDLQNGKICCLLYLKSLLWKRNLFLSFTSWLNCKIPWQFPKWLSADHNLWAWPGESGMCSVSQSINFYKTSHHMMVLLLAGGLRPQKEKQPRNFHFDLTVVNNLLVRRYIDAIKLTALTLFFALNVFLSEIRNFADNKINI